MATHDHVPVSLPSVELGFVEDSSDPDDFNSSRFPSKVGGKPIWLNPSHLPASISCKECNKPCVLLLQVYAPHSDDPATYHRTLYVFMCTDPQCSKPGSTKPFRVYRCQLPRDNPYYDTEESDSDCDYVKPNDSSNEADHGLDRRVDITTPPLCAVCGSHGPSRCGQCMCVHYCSQYHQTYHWKNGHKTMCKDMKSGVYSGPKVKPSTSILIPELLIITETEPEVKENKKTEKDRLKEYEQFVASDSYQESCRRNPGLSEQLNGSEDDSKPDKVFENFKKRVNREPEQVLRFQPGGEPLLISQINPPAVPPVCENCGGSRQFELQVMPQLLYYTKIDLTGTTTGTTTGSTGTQTPSIDWGTLLIYTCTSHCNDTSGYTEEFLWKQDFM